MSEIVQYKQLRFSSIDEYIYELSDISEKLSYMLEINYIYADTYARLQEELDSIEDDLKEIEDTVNYNLNYYLSNSEIIAYAEECLEILKEVRAVVSTMRDKLEKSCITACA
ncbi:MAG: hypothetical protein MJ152_01835 [Clostridia bacterium]|nr:hypothetical protein [Clostridia bacterium]